MSRKSRTDLIVRQRFQNPLPAPAFPPKLLIIKTDPSRYASYDFLVPLSMERPVPMLVDAEGGMHLDQNVVPGYWESETQGRSGNMAPDINTEAPDLDDEDLALLVDPPGVNQAGAGILPSTSGANMDLVGSGRFNGANQSPAALDKRKREVAWLKRTDIAVASQTSRGAQKDILASQLAAQPETQQVTIEEQIDAITSTFSALDMPLESLQHPTKSHLTAVESWDILPDEALWGNQYALFKFADNPFEDKRVGGSETPMPAGHATNMALFRPIETESEDSMVNRVAYFLPDADEIALRYSHTRRQGKDVDWDIIQDTDESVPQDTEPTENDRYAFHFVRDYDAARREARSEYILTLDDGDNEATSGRQKGAYYVPLTGHTLLKKRRARKGEPRNDYSDLGVEYWGGVEVTLGGKDILPEDELEGRKDDIESISKTSR